MLSEATAAEIRSKITDTTHNNVSYYDPAGLQSLSDAGTSEIAASDASGLTITLTTTVNLLFGSHVMVPETGVIMNDEMNGILLSADLPARMLTRLSRLLNPRFVERFWIRAISSKFR